MQQLLQTTLKNHRQKNQQQKNQRHRTSAAHATLTPASKEEAVELVLPLCLFLLFSFHQSLPGFCSMLQMIVSLFCFVHLKHNFELSIIETLLSSAAAISLRSILKFSVHDYMSPKSHPFQKSYCHVLA